MSEHSPSLASLAKLSGFYKERGDDAKSAAYLAELEAGLNSAKTKGEGGPNAEELAGLYNAGAHDGLLLIQKAFPAGFPSSGLLAQMACAIYFARREPQKAMAASRFIANPTPMRLCRKTAELWREIFAPAPERLKALPKVHLLLPVSNQARLLEQTLRTLGKTEYPDYAVYLADNGSTDGTKNIMARAAEFFPPEVAVHTQSFPVDIGRTAARNWLLTGHDHRPAEFVAVCSDSLAKAGPDWMQNLVLTALAFPEAGCIGGKSLIGGSRKYASGVGRHIIALEPDLADLTNSGAEEDLGQFDYIDMADHVSGSPLLYRRKALDEAGIFDIRFSPSQLAELDRHIALHMAGFGVVYNGLTSFEHAPPLGNSEKEKKYQADNFRGNTKKLYYKYNLGEVYETLLKWREKRAAWLA